MATAPPAATLQTAPWGSAHAACQILKDVGVDQGRVVVADEINKV